MKKTDKLDFCSVLVSLRCLLLRSLFVDTLFLLPSLLCVVVVFFFL